MEVNGQFPVNRTDGISQERRLDLRIPVTLRCYVAAEWSRLDTALPGI